MQVGFGKNYGFPMVFAIGVKAGTPGVYRSSDEGRSWRKINRQGFGLGTMDEISGDPKKVGRVYVGTNGRGVWVADQVVAR